MGSTNPSSGQKELPSQFLISRCEQRKGKNSENMHRRLAQLGWPTARRQARKSRLPLIKKRKLDQVSQQSLEKSNTTVRKHHEIRMGVGQSHECLRSSRRKVISTGTCLTPWRKPKRHIYAKVAVLSQHGPKGWFRVSSRWLTDGRSPIRSLPK